MVGASHWSRNNGGIEVRWKLVCSISTQPQSQFLKHRTSAKTMSDQEEPEMKRMRMMCEVQFNDRNARTRYVLMVLNRLWGDRGINTIFYTRRIIVYVRETQPISCDVHHWLDGYGPCFCPVQRRHITPPSPPQAPAPPSPPQSFWDSIPEQLLNGPPSSDDDDTAE